MQKEDQPTALHSAETAQAASPAERARRLMALTGYGMLAASSLLLIATVIPVLLVHQGMPPAPGPEGTFAWFMQYYGTQAISTIAASVLALVGGRFLGVVGKAAPNIIPSDDRALLEPLVRDANKDAIAQYVILSSLSGFTGTFQKVGFSGLPLATVGLTLLFCALSFLKPEFMEFAKLTLGAFIGSFVQRGIEGGKLTSIN